MNRRWVGMVGAVALVASTLAVGVATQASAAPCDPGGNAIVCENSKTGNPASEWDVFGVGDDTIEGFATQISVNIGQTVGFKVKTDARAYGIDIYRMGWYGGAGARKIQSLTPSVSLPQTQPACVSDAATSLYDCGNWGLSASWAVPTTAVSGVYIAKLTRTDTGGASQIIFIVRNDASHSDVVYQTSDTTWQAYNTYGLGSFYSGPNGRATKLSYNRPFSTRGASEGSDFFFSNEYPMLRFLERNGYDLSYISGLDTATAGSSLLNHKVFLSVGHDEYWSGTQRANVEAARNAGVNLAFFAGNEVYWRTRWEPSIDGTSTANRTLVCYKETWDNAKSDPSPEWTGTWRDPRFSPPSSGAGRPENALSGTAYMSNFSDMPVTVSAAEGKQRFWRNTVAASQAAGGSLALANHTVGYESDEDLDNGFRPGGLIHLSTSTGAVPQYLQDFGNTTAPGTTTHHLTMYRQPGGGLVFSAGTVQWAWGLDPEHDGTTTTADPVMQQATINVLGDMGAGTSSLMAGRSAASPSTDSTAPSVTISSPAAGSLQRNGTIVTTTGTASDVGGVVAGVEVSTDGGATWHPATGTTSWTYSYQQTGSSVADIRVRATDDSLNTSSPVVRSVSTTCPCSVFGGTTPKRVDAGDGSAVELGMRVTPSMDGWITGVRFYKSSANTGTHVGSLWSTSGTLLAQGTFANESASGWQELVFDAPVKVTAGTTYIASYWAPSGHYSADEYFFTAHSAVASPLTAPADSASAPNAVFSTQHGFPDRTYHAQNYGVDVLFDDKDTYPPVVLSTTPVDKASSVAPSVHPAVVFSEDIDPATLTFSLKDSAGTPVQGTATYSATTRTASFTPSSTLAAGMTYTATTRAADTVGNTMASYTWTFTSMQPPATPGVCPCGLWDDTAVPTTPSHDDPGPVTVGVRFSSDTDGVVTGLRFYKGVMNTGTHVGSLWTVDGQLLATATFTGESSTGWQTVSFASPVHVTAGTSYIASYRAESGHYAVDWGQFDGVGLDRSPLHVASAGGSFSYTAGFPGNVSNANYWVDVVFTVPPDLAPTVAQRAPGAGATGVASTTTVAARMNTALRAGSGSLSLRDSSGNPVSGSSAYSSTTHTLTFTPSSQLSQGETFTATVAGAVNLGGTPMSAPESWTFTTAGVGTCPCTMFDSSQSPTILDSGETSALTLGVRFRPSIDGFVSGVRFYKAATNTGTHTAGVWAADGTLLGRLTFTGETTSGWQTGTFSQPITVRSGQTYTVGYYAPNGHFSYDPHFYDAATVYGPLVSALPGNGVYSYGGDEFPGTESSSGSSYWVTPVYSPGTAPDTTPPVVSSTSPSAGADHVPATVQPSAVFSEALAPGATLTLGTGGTPVAGTTSYDAATQRLTFVPAAPLQAGTTYTASTQASDTSGNAMTSQTTWTFTTGATQTCPCSLFGPTSTPTTLSVSDAGTSIELGVAVRPATDGVVTAVRFYKNTDNTGDHAVSLWTSDGTRLATAASPASGESASGWQTVTFAAPVAVTGGTTYVASYTNPTMHWSATAGRFADLEYSAPPLAVPVLGGRYAYGGGYPSSASGTSYGVDLVFADGGSPPIVDTTPPVVSAVAAAPSGTSAAITWSTDETSTSLVDYGTTTSLGQTASGVSGTSHSVSLSGLVSGGTYYYRVRSADAAGNSTTSPASGSAPLTFTAADTVAPTITGVTVALGGGGTSAVLTWTTDESSTSTVSYGTATSLGSTATGSTGTAHSVTLTGLSSATTYSYRVTSVDASGNASTSPAPPSPAATFTTPDVTAPTVTSVQATGSGTTATVTWTTDESATSSVSYGTTTSLGSTATGVVGTAHTVSLTGLLRNTRYYYRVTSADPSGNSTTSPTTASAPASYVPTVAPITQTTVADFAPGTGAYESDVAGGEVVSTPTMGAELAGTALPTTLTSTALVVGGTTTVAGGTATLSGTRVASASTWTNGRSFRAAATLGAGSTLGWGSTTASTINRRAQFTLDATGALRALVSSDGTTTASTAVAGSFAGVKREYRIDWTIANTAVFFVDGVQVASLGFNPGTAMRVVAADPTTAAPTTVLDWVLVAPFAASSTYTSGVIDAGATVGWDTLTRDADVPTGTTLTVQVRSGPNANTGSGAWTAWATVPTSNSITRGSRYLQYRLVLTTSGTQFVTSTVRSVQMTYHVL